MCWLLKLWWLWYRDSRAYQTSLRQPLLSLLHMTCLSCLLQKPNGGFWISFESIAADCPPSATFQRISSSAHAEAGWRIQENRIRSTYHCTGQGHDFYLWHDGHQGAGDIVNAGMNFTHNYTLTFFFFFNSNLLSYGERTLCRTVQSSLTLTLPVLTHTFIKLGFHRG